MSKLSSRLQPAHRGHRQSHLSHHAARVTRVLVGCATVAIAIPLTAGSDPGVALAAVRPAQVTDYGSFRLSGPVSGTLVPLATTCDASTSAADVEFSWFGKVTTLKGVSSKSIVSLELDLQGSSYGRKGPSRTPAATHRFSHIAPPPTGVVWPRLGSPSLAPIRRAREASAGPWQWCWTRLTVTRVAWSSRAHGSTAVGVATFDPFMRRQAPSVYFVTATTTGPA